MKLKLLLASALLGSIISSPVLAVKPDRCPSVDVIKYRGLLLAMKAGGEDSYAALQFDRYGTSAPWVFMMDGITATNQQEAQSKGIELLSSLSGNPEPTGDGGWICEYETGKDMKAMAMSLDENNDDNGNLLKVLKFKKYKI